MSSSFVVYFVFTFFYNKISSRKQKKSQGCGSELVKCLATEAALDDELLIAIATTSLAIRKQDQRLAVMP